MKILKLLLIIISVTFFFSCKVRGTVSTAPAPYYYRERIYTPPYYYRWYHPYRRVIIIKHKHK